jgi:hypothetical protein
VSTSGLLRTPIPWPCVRGLIPHSMLPHCTLTSFVWMCPGMRTGREIQWVPFFGRRVHESSPSAVESRLATALLAYTRARCSAWCRSRQGAGRGCRTDSEWRRLRKRADEVLRSRLHTKLRRQVTALKCASRPPERGVSSAVHATYL